MSGIALIGKKIGMSREFYKTGQSIPVTVLKMETGRIIEVIDKEKRGYQAVQVGFGKIKNSKLTKSMKGYFAKKNTEPKKIINEFLDEVENLCICIEMQDAINMLEGKLNANDSLFKGNIELRGNLEVLSKVSSELEKTT